MMVTKVGGLPVQRMPIKFIARLLILCGATVLVDLLYHNFVYTKKGYFAFETMIGFHAFYGLVAFMFVVLTGKQLRKYLMRDEDYYEPDHLSEYQADPQAEDNH